MFKKIFTFLLSSLPLFADHGNIATSNGVDIWYETFGKKENPAVLLIMGACAQGVIWDKTFCERLARKGFYVIRYDHRDIGLSSSFDFEKNPYDLMDMAKDAIQVLDAQIIKKAHIFGISLGGYLAELLGAYYPERVHTLTLMGVASDIRPMNHSFAGLPTENTTFSAPKPEYLAWMKEFIKLSPQTAEEKLANRLEGWNMLNGRKIPLNEEINRKIHTEFLSRLRNPQGMLNHMTVLGSKQSEEWVLTTPYKIKVPVVILQGSEDPIVPPDHGVGLHGAIKGSKYVLVEGMGHVPNDHFYSLYIDILKQQASISP